ncbi:hypothetical protein [Gordonia tangerina]|uniref:Uncharacterized protein n=1 Tax=Gordonia tangerina TaxID=2911060 RepID=A0ABS9DQ38_9ACTN|nr:hypothetical protein [Gordonia tangerina]MCF3940704.1 hypothetical protein [Gordonia tangerina]
MTIELFPRCALPGCANPTDAQGHPCSQCLRDFGGLLRHNPAGQALSATAEAARDRLAGQRDTDIDAGIQGKPGQICWLCDQRRTCTRVADRWECRTCRHITG